jgi:hypothetical protein
VIYVDNEKLQHFNDRYDITAILLTVALNAIKPNQTKNKHNHLCFCMDKIQCFMQI